LTITSQFTVLSAFTTCNSHASGLSGTPFVGQFSRAATSASLNASCASAMSPVREAMYATSRPYESRATASIASCVADSLIVENDFDCDNLRDASRNP
jgi:hypothetical protein